MKLNANEIAFGLKTTKFQYVKICASKVNQEEFHECILIFLSYIVIRLRKYVCWLKRVEL